MSSIHLTQLDVPTVRSVTRTKSLPLFDIKALGDLVYEHINRDSAKISVIIPLYDYAKFVIECLESVVNQTIPVVSITVIDDCSNDGGGEIAAEFLEGHRERLATAQVVKHRRNQGLAMARNSGIAWTSEPFLFMLDADNKIRRPALSRLLEALLSSEAEFAYSQLWLFGSENKVGDAQIWDPQHFVLGNYIDGTALIRRQALLSAGGYQVSAVEEGWEDFDLWCRFVELGYNGVYLPELLCEYRVHEASMLRTRTDSLKKSLEAEMALRHPGLLRRWAVSP
jgi:glycosyltransferase involved in cell wall biosynthesis